MHKEYKKDILKLGEDSSSSNVELLNKYLKKFTKEALEALNDDEYGEGDFLSPLVMGNDQLAEFITFCKMFYKLEHLKNQLLEKYPDWSNHKKALRTLQSGNFSAGNFTTAEKYEDALNYSKRYQAIAGTDDWVRLSQMFLDWE
jgi:hypothetical protein